MHAVGRWWVLLGRTVVGGEDDERPSGRWREMGGQVHCSSIVLASSQSSKKTPSKKPSSSNTHIAQNLIVARLGIWQLLGKLNICRWMKQSTKTVWHDNVGFSRSLLFLNACLVDSAWNSILNMKCKGMEGKRGSAKELSWWEMLLASTLVGGEEKRPNLICKSTSRGWSPFLDFARIFLQRKWKSDYDVVSVSSQHILIYPVLVT